MTTFNLMNEIEKQLNEPMTIRELFSSPSLPNHWIVREWNCVGEKFTHKFYIVPPVAGGWEQRTIYRGHTLGLQRVRKCMGLGLGIPQLREHVADDGQFDPIGQEFSRYFETNRKLN